MSIIVVYGALRIRWTVGILVDTPEYSITSDKIGAQKGVTDGDLSVIMSAIGPIL